MVNRIDARFQGTWAVREKPEVLAAHGAAQGLGGLLRKRCTSDRAAGNSSGYCSGLSSRWKRTLGSLLSGPFSENILILLATGVTWKPRGGSAGTGTGRSRIEDFGSPNPPIHSPRVAISSSRKTRYMAPPGESDARKRLCRGAAGSTRSDAARASRSPPRSAPGASQSSIRRSPRVLSRCWPRA